MRESKTLRRALAFIPTADKITLCVEDGEPFILITAKTVSELKRYWRIEEFLDLEVHFITSVRRKGFTEIFIYVYLE